MVNFIILLYTQQICIPEYENNFYLKYIMKTQCFLRFLTSLLTLIFCYTIVDTSKCVTHVVNNLLVQDTTNRLIKGFHRFSGRYRVPSHSVYFKYYPLYDTHR